MRALIHPAGIPLPAVHWSRTRETVALAWVVAMRPARQPLTYRRLTGIAPGDWTAWTPGDPA